MQPRKSWWLSLFIYHVSAIARTTICISFQTSELTVPSQFLLLLALWVRFCPFFGWHEYPHRLLDLGKTLVLQLTTKRKMSKNESDLQTAFSVSMTEICNITTEPKCPEKEAVCHNRRSRKGINPWKQRRQENNKPFSYRDTQVTFSVCLLFTILLPLILIQKLAAFSFVPLLNLLPSFAHRCWANWNPELIESFCSSLTYEHKMPSTGHKHEIKTPCLTELFRQDFKKEINRY